MGVRLALTVVAALAALAGILFLGSIFSAFGSISATATYRDAWHLFWAAAACAVGATVVGSWMSTR